MLCYEKRTYLHLSKIIGDNSYYLFLAACATTSNTTSQETVEEVQDNKNLSYDEIINNKIAERKQKMLDIDLMGSKAKELRAKMEVMGFDCKEYDTGRANEKNPQRKSGLTCKYPEQRLSWRPWISQMDFEIRTKYHIPQKGRE